jgi:hypothetical protein
MADLADAAKLTGADDAAGNLAAIAQWPAPDEGAGHWCVLSQAAEPQALSASIAAIRLLGRMSVQFSST